MVSLCILQCDIDPVLNVLVNVDLRYCLTDYICLTFQEVYVAKLHNFFLTFADRIKPDEYFDEIHTWDNNDLDHLSSLKDGKCSIDVIQQICVIIVHS